MILNSSYDGGNAPLKFTGSATQTFTVNSGASALYNGDITVNTTGGAAVNLATSALTLDASGQDLIIASGTFDLSGQNLSVTGAGTETIVINNTGNLQLQGGETVTADSASYPQFDPGSTVTYDGTVGPYTMKDWIMTEATLVINGGASSVFTLGANERFENVTINSGILSLGNNEFTVDTAFNNNATLRLRGNEATSLTMDTNSGTVEFTGDGDAGADTYTVTTLSATYNNLTINSTDGATDIFQLGTALDVNGSLVITAGTFNVTGSNYQMNIGRNFSNTGTFNSSSGTVVFDDATGTGTIAGSTSFYNFKCEIAGKPLVFTATTTQTVTGTFTVTGADGNQVSLTSSSDGSQWGLNVSAAVASYVYVKDSDASPGIDIYPTAGFTSGGNNLGWITNVAPTVASVTAIEATNGSGAVTVSFIADDADDNDTVRALVEYNVGAGWIKATLSETSGTGSTYGQFNLENDNSYQIGNSNGYIITSSGANTITAVWNSKTDAPTADLATAQIRVTPYDGFDVGTPGTSSEFTMDNAGPAALAGFSATSTTSSTITWTWTAGTDSHFNHYEIWYGTSESDVSGRIGTALEWDNDPNDTALATATTATTTITGLAEDTTYYAKIWAIDGYGNETTLSVATANNNGKPTLSGISAVESNNANQYVTIQFTVNDSDANDLSALIEYNVGSGWSKATLATSPITATYGTPTVNNSNIYQIGEAGSYIITSSGANTISVIWRSDIDASGIDLNTALIRVTAYDNIETSIVVTSDAFIVDGVAPTTPGSFTKSGGSGTTSVLTWTVSTESHFNHYEIWYGTNQTDVNNRNGTAVEWDNDPNDALLATKTTATTTITGLTPGNTYYAKICSADNYGYEVCGSAISFVTNQTPTAATVTAVQATDGTSNVTITFIVDDVDDDNTLQALVEYNVGAGWNKATLSETSGTGATYGNYNLENDNTYQVGNSNGYIITSSGANTITVIWASASDVTATDISTAQVRATPYDGVIAGSAAISSNFILDQVAPSGGLTDLYTTAIASTSISISWIPETTESNFNRYEIYYKLSADASYTLYGSVTGIGTAASTVSGLSSGKTYNFYVKALDNYGNAAATQVLTVGTTGSSESVVVGGGGGLGDGAHGSGYYSSYDDTADSSLAGEEEVITEDVEIDIEIDENNIQDATEEFEETWESEVVKDIGDHWAEPYLKSFFENTLLSEIIGGEGIDGDESVVINYFFDPDQSVTRIEFLKSTMDLLGIEPAMVITGMSFPDIPTDVDDAYYMQSAYDLGIINGYADTYFKPYQYVNRAEALKMALLANGMNIQFLYGEELLEYYELPGSPFVDIDINAWYAPYVMYAYANGIVSGYGDGTFMPDKIISLGETAKIIVLVMQIE